MRRDLFAKIREALSAASVSDHPEIRSLYLAVARSLYARATVEHRELGCALETREREAVRVAARRTELDVGLTDHEAP